MRIYFLLFIVGILFISCEDDSILEESSAKLSFSTDTVMFDTVFTGIGSATKRFKVYNTYNKPIVISSIELARGTNSLYNLNVYETIANRITDVEVKPNDSIFVFVEVNINPSANDIIEKDSVVFFTNGNMQDVKTIAFGQNINLIGGEYIQTTTWTNEKPYLVYYTSIVDTLETLTIE